MSHNCIIKIIFGLKGLRNGESKLVYSNIARRENNGDFRESTKETLQRVAIGLDGEFIYDGIFKGARVELEYGNWPIYIDTYAQSAGKTVILYTRIRIPFITEKPFKMKVYKKGFFSKIGLALGMQDIPIGNSRFDSEFIVQGDDTNQVRSLLADPEIVAAVENMSKITVEIKHKDPLSSQSLYGNEQLLSLYTVGVIKEIEMYKSILALATKIMDQMADFGHVTEERPQTILYKK